ncbi:MAG: hypothetical protein EOO77_46435 [Oxalobacteraceae bacterium]|nr:MAG: hypothetical protein EOO77_46435 [Oxalobacteraceae bacterium]
MTDTQTTVILCGTRDTIPSDILSLLLRQAREGRGRLMVVDEGSQLARLHADQEVDLLIDPAQGNWDFFADHLTQHEVACAGETILRSDGVAPNIYNAVSCVLADMLWEVAAKPGARLQDVSEKVRGFEYNSIADAMHLDLDTPADTRAGWTALARLQEDAGRFATGSPTNITSIRRWLTKSPRSVLFVTAGAAVNDGACRSVQAAIDCVARLEVSDGREVQIVQIHTASSSGARLRDASQLSVPWQSRTEGRC